MAFTTIILSDSSKNLKAIVRGFFTSDLIEPTVVLDLDKLKDSPQHIRIDSLWWLMEEKMGLRLWWDNGQLLVPMESRNSMRFDHPLSSRELTSEKWTRKLYITSHSIESGLTKQKYFTFGLDAEKQGQ